MYYNNIFSDNGDLPTENSLSLSSSTPTINSDQAVSFVKHDRIAAMVCIIIFFAILFAFSLYET